jgi:hypothetical protein
MLARYSWKMKAPIAAGGALTVFLGMKWWCYRPVLKKYPGDMVVTVERSGGGL